MMHERGLKTEHYDRYPHIPPAASQRIAIARGLMLDPT